MNLPEAAFVFSLFSIWPEDGGVTVYCNNSHHNNPFKLLTLQLLYLWWKSKPRRISCLSGAVIRVSMSLQRETESDIQCMEISQFVVGLLSKCGTTNTEHENVFTVF